MAYNSFHKVLKFQVEDLLFAAGEAISFIWGGVPVTADLMLKSNYNSLSDSSNYLSGEMALSILESGSLESDINEESRVMAREVIVKKLFEDLLYSGRKDERCAGTVWLLSLTMYCGYDPKIQQFLPEIQVSLLITYFFPSISCFFSCNLF